MATSFPPAAHDHAVVEDATSGLVAAATIQALAEALSARILVLETAAGRVMVIKLTRDVEVGRMGEVIDLPYQRATYLIRMGAALEWKQTADVDDVERQGQR